MSEAPEFSQEQLRGAEAAISAACEACLYLPEALIVTLLEKYETSRRVLPIKEFKRDIGPQMKNLRISILMTREFLGIP